MQLQLCEIANLLAGWGGSFSFFTGWGGVRRWSGIANGAPARVRTPKREERSWWRPVVSHLSHHFHTWLFPMGGFFHRYPARIIFHQNARTLFCQNELASCTAKYFCARQNNPVTQKLSKSNFYQDESEFQTLRSIHAFPGLVHRSVKNVCNQWSARWHIFQC